MKFNFHAKVKNIISEIASYEKEQLIQDPKIDFLGIINKLSKETDERRFKKELGNKEHNLIKRQLSFLYALWHPLLKIEDSYKEKAATDAKINFLKAIKNIESEEALKNVFVVKVSILYGVLKLSNFEINKLIELNTIISDNSVIDFISESPLHVKVTIDNEIIGVILVNCKEFTSPLGEYNLDGCKYSFVTTRGKFGWMFEDILPGDIEEVKHQIMKKFNDYKGEYEG